MAFLKPTGMESPEAICRCEFRDSEVLAPIAAQQRESERYWGVMGVQQLRGWWNLESITSPKMIWLSEALMECRNYHLASDP